MHDKHVNGHSLCTSPLIQKSSKNSYFDNFESFGFTLDSYNSVNVRDRMNDVNGYTVQWEANTSINAIIAFYFTISTQ